MVFEKKVSANIILAAFLIVVFGLDITSYFAADDSLFAVYSDKLLFNMQFNEFFPATPLSRPLPAIIDFIAWCYAKATFPFFGLFLKLITAMLWFYGWYLFGKLNVSMARWVLLTAFLLIFTIFLNITMLSIACTALGFMGWQLARQTDSRKQTIVAVIFLIAGVFLRFNTSMLALGFMLALEIIRRKTGGESFKGLAKNTIPLMAFYLAAGIIHEANTSPVYRQTLEPYMKYDVILYDCYLPRENSDSDIIAIGMKQWCLFDSSFTNIEKIKTLTYPSPFQWQIILNIPQKLYRFAAENSFSLKTIPVNSIFIYLICALFLWPFAGAKRAGPALSIGLYLLLLIFFTVFVKIESRVMAPLLFGVVASGALTNKTRTDYINKWGYYFSTGLLMLALIYSLYNSQNYRRQCSEVISQAGTNTRRIFFDMNALTLLGGTPTAKNIAAQDISYETVGEYYTYFYSNYKKLMLSKYGSTDIDVIYRSLGNDPTAVFLYTDFRVVYLNEYFKERDLGIQFTKVRPALTKGYLYVPYYINLSYYRLEKTNNSLKSEGY